MSSSLGLCKRARRIHDVDSDDDAAVPHTASQAEAQAQAKQYIQKKVLPFRSFALFAVLCSAAAAATAAAGEHRKKMAATAR